MKNSLELWQNNDCWWCHRLECFLKVGCHLKSTHLKLDERKKPNTIVVAGQRLGQWWKKFRKLANVKGSQDTCLCCWIWIWSVWFPSSNLCLLLKSNARTIQRMNTILIYWGLLWSRVHYICVPGPFVFVQNYLGQHAFLHKNFKKFKLKF